MKVVLLSYPSFFEQEIALLSSFFDEGLQYFHIRKPGAGEKDVRHFLDVLPRKYYNKIVLHDHFHLVGEYGLKGIHFSRHSMELIPRYENYCFHKSISMHSMEEVDAIQYVSYDYVFLSPVFDSISKPGYEATIDLGLFKEWQNGRNFPFTLIALGGVNSENASSVENAGFGGVALLGYVWNRFFEDEDISGTTLHFSRFLQDVS